MTNLEELRSSLLEQLQVLESRHDKVTSDLRKLPEQDSEERAQERENDEVLESLSARDLETMGEIREAIGRIDAGTYGVCQACGEPIAKQRLEAMPFARRCVECAS